MKYVVLLYGCEKFESDNELIANEYARLTPGSVVVEMQR